MEGSTVAARRLITDIGVVEYPVVSIGADGLITEIASDVSIQSQETLTAAFFDVHTHGAAGHDVMEATPEALATVGRFLASHGVAHFLPTTITAPLDRTLRSLDGLGKAVERGSQPGVAEPIGIHLEGPFISQAKRGVHPPADILPPSIVMFERFQEASGGTIRLLTVAPELPGALDLIRHATGKGVRVSIGHTNATSAETRAGISAGASNATHTFNAMRPLDHREPGVLGVVLDDDRIFAELICDGVHVAPELVRLWMKCKGPARAILVTDSMAATGMPDGSYKLGGLDVEVKGDRCLSGGALAGSVLTLDRAVENLQRFTGVSLADAVAAASHVPARAMGVPERTRLAVGRPASLNRFSADGTLIASYIRGVQVRGGQRSF